MTKAVLDSPSIPIAICPRCLGAYDSILHGICEAELQLAEKAEGWRLNQVRIRPEIRQLLGAPR